MGQRVASHGYSAGECGEPERTRRGTPQLVKSLFVNSRAQKPDRSFIALSRMSMNTMRVVLLLIAGTAGISVVSCVEVEQLTWVGRTQAASRGLLRVSLPLSRHPQGLARAAPPAVFVSAFSRAQPLCCRLKHTVRDQEYRRAVTETLQTSSPEPSPQAVVKAFSPHARHSQYLQAGPRDPHTNTTA